MMLKFCIIWLLFLHRHIHLSLIALLYLLNSQTVYLIYNIQYCFPFYSLYIYFKYSLSSTHISLVLHYDGCCFLLLFLKYFQVQIWRLLFICISNSIKCFNCKINFWHQVYNLLHFCVWKLTQSNGTLIIDNL
jgi:hypothetical protein